MSIKQNCKHCLISQNITIGPILGLRPPVPGRVYLEYHFDDYSGWLRRRVEGPLKWERIKFCLSTSTMFAELNQSYHFAQDFFKTYLTPLQSGCCKPPTECGYTFVNPTYWISPISSAANKDCMEWSNEQTQLCYGCDSCKAGLIANLRREWRRADVILLCTLIGLVVVYLMGCCAFRNAKTEELFRSMEPSDGHTLGFRNAKTEELFRSMEPSDGHTLGNFASGFLENVGLIYGLKVHVPVPNL
ncbi:TORNADO 2 protein [Nymphaea thermarum]|nr:TORNADO 2 protein [Nymphaea thermarum]